MKNWIPTRHISDDAIWPWTQKVHIRVVLKYFKSLGLSAKEDPKEYDSVIVKGNKKVIVRPAYTHNGSWLVKAIGIRKYHSAAIVMPNRDVHIMLKKEFEEGQQKDGRRSVTKIVKEYLPDYDFKIPYVNPPKGKEMTHQEYKNFFDKLK